MEDLIIILIATLSMSLLAWAGLLVIFLGEKRLKRIILFLVSFSAGALLSGAFFHMLPEALEKTDNVLWVFIWVVAGFSLFFLLEQFISWHHCHKTPCEHKKPVTYLILFADGLHNFIGGLAIAGAFLVDFRIGIVTWLVAAAHEVPQELGDFGILIHGGWSKYKALLFNFLSALTIVVGGLVAYFMSSKLNIVYLLPFAAGNFIYISASDLIPEVKHDKNIIKNIIHFISFVLGLIIVLSFTFLEI